MAKMVDMGDRTGAEGVELRPWETPIQRASRNEYHA